MGAAEGCRRRWTRTVARWTRMQCWCRECPRTRSLTWCGRRAGKRKMGRGCRKVCGEGIRGTWVACVLWVWRWEESERGMLPFWMAKIDTSGTRAWVVAPPVQQDLANEWNDFEIWDFIGSFPGLQQARGVTSERDLHVHADFKEGGYGSLSMCPIVSNLKSLSVWFSTSIQSLRGPYKLFSKRRLHHVPWPWYAWHVYTTCCVSNELPQHFCYCNHLSVRYSSYSVSRHRVQTKLVLFILFCEYFPNRFWEAANGQDLMTVSPGLLTRIRTRIGYLSAYPFIWAHYPCNIGQHPMRQ